MKVFIDSSEKAACLLAKAAQRPSASDMEEAEEWRTGPRFFENCAQVGLDLLERAGEGRQPLADDVKLRRRVEDALRKQGDPRLVRGLALALGLRLD